MRKKEEILNEIKTNNESLEGNTIIEILLDIRDILKYK